MNDYKRAKESLSDLPRFYLGQEVETDLGVGVIVNMKMDFNGLYLEPLSSKAIVWFSTESSKQGWVSYTFFFNEIKPYLKGDRNEKIKKLEKL
jgi:hypothetical protein